MLNPTILSSIRLLALLINVVVEVAPVAVVVVGAIFEMEEAVFQGISGINSNVIIVDGLNI